MFDLSLFSGFGPASAGAWTTVAVARYDDHGGRAGSTVRTWTCTSTAQSPSWSLCPRCACRSQNSNRC